MSDPRHSEDVRLVLDVGNGDERALETIYDRYAQRIYSLAMSVLKDEGLAEDAVQEVFSNIWQKSSSYRPEMSAPGTWIMSVAHHKIVDFYRSRRRTTDHTTQPEMETLLRLPDQKLSVEQEVERNFNARLVRAALMGIAGGAEPAVVSIGVAWLQPVRDCQDAGHPVRHG